MEHLFAILRRTRSARIGQDMVEYVLIMALISVIAIAAVTAAGTSIQGLWQAIAGGLAGVP